MTKRGQGLDWRKAVKRSKARIETEERRALLARRFSPPEREIPPRKPLTDSRGQPITLPKVSILESEI